MTSDSLRLSSKATTWSQAEGLTVLLDLKDDHYYVVNDVGSLLWKMLSGGTTPTAMVDTLIERYGIDQGRAAFDVDAFLDQCRSHGYVESTD